MQYFQDFVQSPCFVMPFFLSSFAIIPLGKSEMVAFLFKVMPVGIVLCFFLVVPSVDLRCLIDWSDETAKML